MDTSHHSGGAVPSLDLALADTIEKFLMARYDMRRPPIAAARLLAVIVLLDEQKQPFPSRRRVAEEIRCSVYGIDAALQVAMARGLISQHVEIAQGNVQRRESILRNRYYVPSDELRALRGRRRAA
jgi:hypothetical protein